MLYREIMAVCSEIHTEHINTLCGLNVEFLDGKLGGTYSDHCAVHIVTTGLQWVNYKEKNQSVPRSKHSPSLV